jgi:PTS hybrid protein
MSARVALVVVSHSDLLARGVAEVAGQMAPDVLVEAAGGTDDLSLGTSYDRVEHAVDAALESVGGDDAPEGAGVVVLTDLGSATMTVESVLDMADDAGRLVFADAPLVEGAVAAAVRAQLGDGVAAVARAARGAVDAFAAAAPSSSPEPAGPVLRDPVAVIRAAPALDAADAVEGEATVADPVGLHARPAAQLARLAGTFDAEVTVDGASADSVLELMALGVRRGDVVRISATGPQAAEAVEALTRMLEQGGEPVGTVGSAQP